MGCDGGTTADCAAAWDTVELSAEAAHQKAKEKKKDPMEEFCDESPDADECRVYEDRSPHGLPLRNTNLQVHEIFEIFIQSCSLLSLKCLHHRVLFFTSLAPRRARPRQPPCPPC